MPISPQKVKPETGANHSDIKYAAFLADITPECFPPTNQF